MLVGLTGTELEDWKALLVGEKSKLNIASEKGTVENYKADLRRVARFISSAVDKVRAGPPKNFFFS